MDRSAGQVWWLPLFPARHLIPDDTLGIWIPTDPKIHAELATTANKNFGRRCGDAAA
jgi:hypothetical protein